MSVTLPPEAAFDPYRASGADIPAALAAALAVPATPPGQEVVETRIVWNGLVKRGTLDANGKRLSSFYFPKSLAQVDKRILGSGNSPYAYKDGFCRGKANTLSIIMNMDFVCPNTYAPAHNHEQGWNVVYHTDPSARLILINCGFYNVDTAVVLGGDHSHAQNLEIGVRGSYKDGVYVAPKRTGLAAHYGVRLSGEAQVLDGLRMPGMTAHHDVSTQGTRRCVHMNLRGKALKTDFHAYGNDENDDGNLFLNLNRGSANATRCFASGGSTANLPWTGDGTLFCNDRRGDGTLVPASWYPGWLHATILPDHTPPPAPVGFPEGATVETTVRVNVRALPALSAVKLGTQPAGYLAIVISPPVYDPVSGYTYQRLDFGSGVDGYVGLVSTDGKKNVVAA